MRETVPIYCPLPFKELIEKSWAQRPEDRPKWSWILERINQSQNLEMDSALIEYLNQEEKSIKGRVTIDLQGISASSATGTPSSSPSSPASAPSSPVASRSGITRNAQKSPPKKNAKKAEVTDGFERVFTDKTLYTSFEEYLQKVLDADNLYFYKDVHDFKMKEFKKQEDMEESAREIARKYGLDGEAMILSVDNGLVLTEIQKSFTEGKITQSMFDAIVDDVADVLLSRWVTWSTEKYSKKKKKPRWFESFEFDKGKLESTKAKVGKMIRILGKRKTKEDED